MKPHSSTYTLQQIVKIAFVFCFKFKIHALSNGRVAVLETTFFVHGNCRQLFQRTFFSQSYSAAPKLMTDHWSDHRCKQFCLYSPGPLLVYSSTQRNIVLPCKLRIPESKLLALFNTLRITFFHENPNFMVFQTFKTSCSKQQLWPALAAILLVTRPKTHAIEACIFKYDVNKKKFQKKRTGAET